MNNPTPPAGTTLVDDVWGTIVEYLSRDYATLARCALVSKSMNVMASKLLYARVVWAPQYASSALPSERSLLQSACLTKYSHYVQSLEIGGYIAVRPSTTSILLKVIRAFTNLRRCTLHSLRKLPLSMLEEFVLELVGIDTIVCIATAGDGTIPTPLVTQLMGIKNLQSLTIRSPSRGVLDVLPFTLISLEDRLQELHLQGNCGSITPGVLRDLSPPLLGIKAFTLGLSYSLTDSDVASFLTPLTKLETLSLYYYHQMAGLFPFGDRLAKLRSFSVHFNPPERKTEVNRLCKWIRRVIFHSRLDHIALLPELGRDTWMTLPVAYDALFASLSVRHAQTLRHIEAGSIYASANIFSQLFSSLSVIETIEIAVGLSAINRILEPKDIPRFLHTLVINLRHGKKTKAGAAAQNLSDDLVRDLMKGSRILRSVTINGIIWEGAWVLDGEMTFKVKRALPSTPPWEREKR